MRFMSKEYNLIGKSCAIFGYPTSGELSGNSSNTILSVFLCSVVGSVINIRALTNGARRLIPLRRASYTTRLGSAKLLVS